jgi:pSer/pThr/pTyr-binding forkhead associated (FHA) protein
VGKIVSLGSGPENSIRILTARCSKARRRGHRRQQLRSSTRLKNGVLVNGKKTPRRFLRNGDVITLGMTEFVRVRRRGRRRGGGPKFPQRGRTNRRAPA